MYSVEDVLHKKCAAPVTALHCLASLLPASPNWGCADWHLLLVSHQPHFKKPKLSFLKELGGKKRLLRAH